MPGGSRPKTPVYRPPGIPFRKPNSSVAQAAGRTCLANRVKLGGLLIVYGGVLGVFAEKSHATAKAGQA
jgi:hypothetical protein